MGVSHSHDCSAFNAERIRTRKARVLTCIKTKPTGTQAEGDERDVSVNYLMMASWQVGKNDASFSLKNKHFCRTTFRTFDENKSRFSISALVQVPFPFP